MRVKMAVLAGVLALATGCGASAGSGPGRSAVLFDDNCAKCHGESGHGQLDIAAPAIAGLPDWYVSAQLMKFRTGVRGAHGDDLEGLRMRPMSRTIPASDVEPIAAYVATLPPVPEETNLSADAIAAGDKHYAKYGCAACHGAKGEGDPKQAAPPISQLQPWYIESQLRKFKSEIRGAHPDDEEGKRMAPMSKLIPDDKVASELAAYVSNL